MQPEKAEKDVSEARKQRKWRETTEKDLSAADAYEAVGFLNSITKFKS
ncbi:hypothetical protein [Paenibacillus alginolyticus]|nr:hypothetical protein [Paenibacillus alginolyticus]MEC0147824.1 hypothetical protein [Paenibacillus alginolyticus]